MTRNTHESAGPALRGFRLQILYSLARLTEPQTMLQATLWPEGIEDLAILDSDGNLREAIQIKGHTDPLTLSELISREGKGLLQRATAIAREHRECRIRLLSFGPFGQELLGAWRGQRGSRERVSTKLKRAGIKPADIDLLFSRVTLESADEREEKHKVEQFLESHPGLMKISSELVK
jgi:hypothetical protein